MLGNKCEEVLYTQAPKIPLLKVKAQIWWLRGPDQLQSIRGTFALPLRTHYTFLRKFRHFLHRNHEHQSLDHIASSLSQRLMYSIHWKVCCQCLGLLEQFYFQLFQSNLELFLSHLACPLWTHGIGTLSSWTHHCHVSFWWTMNCWF